MLHLAEKAFSPGADPVPGDARRHRPQLPRGPRLPRPLGREARRSARRRVRAGRHRRRGIVEDDRQRLAATAPDRHAARGDRGARLRRRCSAAARRDEEKARAKERVFSFRDEFGQWDPKNQRPELWSLYNGRIHAGEHIRVFPLSNWTELDVWHYIAARRSRSRRSTSPTSARSFERDGMLHVGRPELSPCRDGETVEERMVRFRTVGDMHLHRRVESRRRHRRRDHRRDRRRPRSPSAAPPAATTGSPRPPWKTARRRATSDGQPSPAIRRWTCSVRHRRLRRRRQVARSSAACCYDSKSIFEDQLEAVERASAATAATTTPTWRCSPTACAPSASRASPSTWPTATSPPRAASSSSPTPPGHIQYTRNMVTGASTADLAPRSSSTPARASPSSRRRHAVPALAAAASRTSCCASTRWTSSTSREEVFEEIHDEFTRLRDASSTIPDLDVHPDLGAARRQRRRPLRRTCPGTTARRCCTTSSTSTSPPTATWSTSASRCSTSIRPQVRRAPRLPRLRRPGGRRRAQAGRRGRRAAVSGLDVHDRRRSTPPTGRSTRPSRRCRSRCALDDDIDVSRGDMIARPQQRADVGQDIDAHGLLDGRDRAAHARAPSSRSSTPPAGRGRWSRTSSTGSTSTRCTATRTPSSSVAQRDRPRHAAHHAAAVRRPLPQNRTDGLVHPRRRGEQQHRRGRHDRADARTVARESRGAGRSHRPDGGSGTDLRGLAPPGGSALRASPGPRPPAPGGARPAASRPCAGPRRPCAHAARP